MSMLKVDDVSIRILGGLAALLLTLYGCQVTGTSYTGRKSPADSDETARVFDTLDRNKDGFLLLTEIPQSNSGLRNQFDRIDTDGDGKLSREEISMIFSNRRPMAAPASSAPAVSDETARVFDSLDRNKDGALSLTEIPKSRSGLRNQFDRIDIDGDGKLSREEISVIISRRPASAVPTSSVPAEPKQGDPWARVRWELDSRVADGTLRGVGLAVYSPTGALVFEHEAGDFSNDRWVPIASSTKWITATVIYTLIRDGLLELSTTTGEILDWKGEPAKITVAQLLSFTSGFRGRHDCLSAVPIIERDGKIVTPGKVLTIKECARQLYRDAGASSSLFSPPKNDIFAYNALHMVILGAMAEAVTGRSWNDLYELRIRVPMDLDPNMRYMKSNRLDGNVISNVDNYSRFLRHLYADSSLGSIPRSNLFPGELVDRGLIDQLTRRTRISFAPSLNYKEPQEIHYGFGTWVQCENYADVDQCARSALVFSAGGYGWLPFIDKRNGFYGVLGMYETLRPGHRSGGEKAKLTFDAIRPLITQGMVVSPTGLSAGLAGVKSGTQASGAGGLSVPAGDVMQISPQGLSFIDPEVMQEHQKLTFMDKEHRIWVGDVDPLTGTFVSADGMDLLIDTDHVDLKLTNTGPEYGLDRNGWSVVYTKQVGETLQVWRGRLNGNGVVAEPLTSGLPALGAVPSKNRSAASTRILAVQGSWKKGDLVWIDLDRPLKRHVLAPVGDNTDARWVDGSNLAVTTLGEPDYGQLALLDSDTNKIKRITNDEGNKTRPYGWFAPEAGDSRVRVLAIVDQRALAVYEDRGGKYWDRILTIPIPAESSGVSMSSPEPFVAGGRSYASITVVVTKRRPPHTDAQIWVIDLSGFGEQARAWRCDDGDPAPTFRADPEAFIGSEQVFVYYSIYGRRTGISINRCATGIRTGP